ncbi:MAG: hypothetical protein ACJ71Q_09045 [Terriglobales bacterium]
MNIKEFAVQHRLTARKDEDATDIILGKLGQIYEFSSQQLGVVFMPPGKPRARLWNKTRERCIATGMTLRQNGDAEGALSFDPRNREQAKLAIRVTGVRPKRQLSPEHKAKLLAATVITRFKPQKHGSKRAFSGLKTSASPGMTPSITPKVKEQINAI